MGLTFRLRPSGSAPPIQMMFLLNSLEGSVPLADGLSASHDQRHYVLLLRRNRRRELADVVATTAVRMSMAASPLFLCGSSRSGSVLPYKTSYGRHPDGRLGHHRCCPRRCLLS